MHIPKLRAIMSIIPVAFEQVEVSLRICTSVAWDRSIEGFQILDQVVKINVAR